MTRVNANEGFSRQLLSKLILTTCPNLGFSEDFLEAGLGRLVEDAGKALVLSRPLDTPPSILVVAMIDGMPGETLATLMVVCDEYARTVLSGKT